MPDVPKSNAKNETADDFIQKEIARTKTNLHCAVNSLGHSALKAANPVPWFKRYPVKASIVTAAALAGGALCIVRAIRKKPEGAREQAGVPVNVYIKKPKSQSKSWGTQLGTALLAALTAKVSEGVRSTISNSLSDEYTGSGRTQTVLVPNPKLRDVDI